MRYFLTFVFSFLAVMALGQNFVVRDIKSFGARGDGKTNDHEAFMRAAAFFNSRGGNGKLVISQGTYIVGKQAYNKKDPDKAVFEGLTLLEFRKISNLAITGSGSPVKKYASGLKFGSFVPETGRPSNNGGNFYTYAYAAFIRNAIQLTECSNIQIGNLELHGNNQGIVLGGIWGDVGRQLPHSGIMIENSTQITINNVNAHHFGLDGIQIMNKTGDSPVKDKITISNCAFEYNARQGLSWVGGNDLTVIKTSFNHTGKGKFSSAPSAGVDIEAEVGPVKNGKFINCEFVNNRGCGLVADNGPSSNCTFTHCLFWGIDLWSAWVRKPKFTFDNCTFHGSIVHGFSAEKNEDATVYRNCLFEDKPYNGKEVYGGFLIESNYAKRVRFENCTLKSSRKKLAWIAANENSGAEEKYQLVNCQFLYEGDNFPLNDAIALLEGIRYSNCTFEVKSSSAKKKKYFLLGIKGKNNIDQGNNKFLLQ